MASACWSRCSSPRDARDGQTRNFNLSLVYTNHVYFNEYYWDDGEFHYDVNRADTLMFGAEAWF